MKGINPFDVAYEQYQRLTEMLQSAIDETEKDQIHRRLLNLARVMQFLNSNSEPPLSAS